jgi:FkbM family methyltransferase
MYKNNRGYKEWTLDEKLFKKELINKCNIFDIDNINDIKFYSYQDEDKYIIQYLLKSKISDGVYLECGAFDRGEDTKTLENNFGFTGILIEPIPDKFKILEKSRPNNELYNCAISNQDLSYIEFIGDNTQAGVLNTINTDLNKNNWKNSYKVKNKKMKDILKNSKFKYIDFMIIDVEGGELELLKSIDFSFPIFCIIIEAHSNEQEKNKIFGNYLKNNGFTFRERQRGNEVWINHNYFRKHLFNYDDVIENTYENEKVFNIDINSNLQFKLV